VLSGARRDASEIGGYSSQSGTGADGPTRAIERSVDINK
jgi:hypothetical protein